MSVDGSARRDELAVLAETWLASYGRENTRSAYGSDLAAFSRWCEGSGRLTLSATTADVARYLAWSQECGASGATLARRRSALASFFQFACQLEQRDTNPVTTVEAPSSSASSSTAVLSDRDAQALLRASDRIGTKTAALVRLLMLDGLGLGEVLACDVGDLRSTRTTGSLLVRRRVRPRAVPLSSPTIRRLGGYVGRRRSGPLLLSDTPGREAARLTRFGADYLLKETARAARVAPVSANTLRRRYVAASANAGTHIDDIRDHLGHRDVRTTSRYLDSHTNNVDSELSCSTERR